MIIQVGSIRTRNINKDTPSTDIPIYKEIDIDNLSISNLELFRKILNSNSGDLKNEQKRK